MKTCKQLQDNYKNLAEKNSLVITSGHCRTIRNSKNIAFIELNDGSTLSNVQLVLLKDNVDFNVNDLTINTSIHVTGYIKETPNREQSFEIKVDKIDVINLSNDETYPLQKKEQTTEFLRTIQEYRLSTKFFQNVFRVKQSVLDAFMMYFKENNYMWVHTPITTTNDAEGGGEAFQVDHKNEFFNKDTYLTVSGQLNAEVVAQSFNKVYTLGPTFRAEQSDTPSHAAEFWMLEPEVTYFDQEKMIEEIKETLSYVAFHLLNNNQESIDFLNENSKVDLKNRLEQVSKKDFQQILYKDALDILMIANENEKFQFNSFNFGDPIQKEHEQYLCKHFKKPIILRNFPMKDSPFYMYDNGDKTSRSYDFIVPQVGEIVGGSQREERHNNLEKQIKEKANIKSLKWYLDMRKHGYATSSGYGLGIERIVMYFTGVQNIRDIQLFPRTYKQISF